MVRHVQAGVSEPVLKRLRDAAKFEKRSLSNFTGKILSDFAEAQLGLTKDALSDESGGVS